MKSIPKSYYGIRSIKNKDIKKINVWVHVCPYCEKIALFEDEPGDDEHIQCPECGETIFVEG